LVGVADVPSDGIAAVGSAVRETTEVVGAEGLTGREDHAFPAVAIPRVAYGVDGVFQVGVDARGGMVIHALAFRGDSCLVAQCFLWILPLPLFLSRPNAFVFVGGKFLADEIRFTFHHSIIVARAPFLGVEATFVIGAMILANIPIRIKIVLHAIIVE